MQEIEKVFPRMCLINRRFPRLTLQQRRELCWRTLERVVRQGAKSRLTMQQVADAFYAIGFLSFGLRMGRTAQHMEQLAAGININGNGHQGGADASI